MKHVFLVNKYSLKKKTDSLVKKIEEVCKELEINYVIEIICKENQMNDALQKYLNNKNILMAVRWRWYNKPYSKQHNRN